MKSANPRNAPVIRPRRPTFCRCRRRAAAAASADSFIVLFSRALMDFCLTTSEFLHRLAAHRPSITQSHVTPGGGKPGLLRAAATGPSAQTQSQHQDQQKTPPQTRTSMQRARCPAILVLAALALCSLGVSSQADREEDQNQNQDLDLELELRRHRLLQKAHRAGLLAQEWGKRAVEDLLAQMSRPEVEAQQADVVSMATEGRMNLERSVDPPNNVQQRDRKAGCKNFYWKGFTSC